MEGWASIVGTLTAPGLLLLFGLMIFRGDIIPRKTVERELKTITESRDHWRDTSQALTEANTLLTKALSDNRAVDESVIRVMQVVQQEARSGINGASLEKNAEV